MNDSRILDDLEKINTSPNIEEGAKIWEDLQLYMWETSLPVIKLGNQKSFMVASSKTEGLELFERIIFVNAKVYE